MTNNSFLIVLLVVLSFCSVKTFATYSSDEGHVEVAMRLIGHELLLSTGDSVSRILPVSKVGNRYKIQFDTEFQFKAQTLIAKVDSVIALTDIASAYRVEMEECTTEEIIYSFQVSPAAQPSLIPCGPRLQPKSCYSLFITLLDPPVAIEQEAGFGWMNYKIIFPLLFIIGLFAYLFRRKKAPETIQNPDLIQLGKYIFDKRNMALSFENNTTELTSKETDLLATLHSSANATLEREVILNAVWGDEGDYVGRTLDVFVSKLRKKLEGDPSIKIANIRGIGYKLILNDRK
ncbi:MAG: hypothetical protein ACJAU0_000137 [Flavobacteriales bacterium]|jgi:hypothetical protein